MALTAFGPASPTPLFETFWRFAAERQAIYFRRLHGQAAPWTTDPVLREYKFTNAYRAADRVSQYLIRDIAYAGNQDPEEVFFRIILFKLFNRIETWKSLQHALGGLVKDDFSVQRYQAVLDNLLAQGEKLYSAAYIMPPARRAFEKKHVGHLYLLERMIRDRLALRLQAAESMSEVYSLLQSYPTLGPFLAYQYTIDLNYSSLLHFSEMDFVVPGPGARRGLRKCFSDFGNLKEEELIRLVTENQAEQFQHLGIHFQDLWGRPLQLIDVQNLFCEVDKYSRAMPSHHHIERNRIKQRFHPQPLPALPWFPPKWGLNEKIPN